MCEHVRVCTVEGVNSGHEGVGSQSHDIIRPPHICHLGCRLRLAVVVEHLLPVAKVHTYLQTISIAC